MIIYIKTFEVIFSTNNLSGMHISTMWHSLNVLKYFCPLSVGLIVVDLECVATSLCSLLSNTGFFAYRFFCLFSRAFSGAKNPDFDCTKKLCSTRAELC